MNERRRILSSELAADAVTLRVTTTDGSTNVGIEMVVTNGSDVYPVTTDSQGKAVITGLSGGCTIDCETHEISVHEFIATGTMTVDISAYVNSFPVGETRSYNYTGAASEVQLIPGTYKLQVWGAQGGSNASASSYSISAQSGGKGGYSEGIITLSSPTTFLVYVGGQGTSSAGGFNGGGSTTGTSQYNASSEFGYSKMGGGGGATDIRLSDGALLSRMIVAGGGSGGAMCYQSKTTSSTSWQNSGITASNQYPFQNYYDYIFGGFSNGTVYKFSCSGSPQGIYLYWGSSGYSVSNNSSFTFTSTYNGNSFSYALVRYNGSSNPGASITIYQQVSSSSTTTNHDSQVGYAGGGTSGLGTYPGTQSSAGSGGSFGTGAAMSASNYRYCSGAGGGGWYGGGSAYSDSAMSYVRYMGGGSGFVNIAASASNRPTGYTGLELDSGETKAGNTSFPNTAGTGNETGHAGNGYAKITRIAEYSVTLRFIDEEGDPLTGASITVTNLEYTYNLTTDSNGEATGTVINGTYTVSCQGYSLDVTSITVTGNQTFSFNATELLDFSYTGAAQTKILKAGTYKIECWGAQGGSYDTSYPGGKGGYSVGEITLEEDTTLYIMVGGQGTGGTSTGYKAGGFNGGGQGYCASSTYPFAGGGGASDVRIGQDSLYARVIVAGGGGAAGGYSSSIYAGGYGGGTTGGTPSSIYSSSYPAGTGGSQTDKGTSYYNSNNVNSTTYGYIAAFGQGGGTNSSYQISGGGGGWYGGGYSMRDPAGGGSGYVYTQDTKNNYPSGCLLTDAHLLDFAQTIAGNTSMPSTSGGTETGHAGNGYVRISKVTYNTVTLHFETEGEPLEGAVITVTATGMSKTATTDSNGDAVFMLPDGTYTVSCVGYVLDSSTLTVSGDTSASYEATESPIREYSYTGAVQTDTLAPGTYKLECWGAQGGYRSNTTYGGNGGYSVGELTLSQNTNIYVYVGGAGNTGGTSGGFNGGGMRATYAGGGGGSDVRIGQDSLYARVIVAGGGGSDGATSKQGMYGGGTTGGTTTEYYGTGGGGGTQTSGGTGSSSASGSGTSGTYGAFGVGGRGYAASNGYAGAGGGGWYGGAGSYPDGSGDDDRGGGGGSGYVYNSSTASSYPSGCLLNSSHYLDNSQTIAGNASMPSTSGSTETGHSGNGFVRITKI